MDKVVSRTQSLHFIPQGFIQTEKVLQFSPKRIRNTSRCKLYLSFPRMNVSFCTNLKKSFNKRKYYEKGIEEFASPNYFGYRGEFVVEILCYFYTILLRFFLHLFNSLATIATL